MGSRLVAKTVSLGQAPKSAITSSVLGCRRCSQLSSTTIIWRSFTKPVIVSIVERPG